MFEKYDNQKVGNADKWLLLIRITNQLLTHDPTNKYLEYSSFISISMEISYFTSADMSELQNLTSEGSVDI